MNEIIIPTTWDELRAANRKLRGIEESDFKMCEACEVQHDCADIYEVDGEQLCESCIGISG